MALRGPEQRTDAYQALAAKRFVKQSAPVLFKSPDGNITTAQLVELADSPKGIASVLLVGGKQASVTAYRDTDEIFITVQADGGMHSVSLKITTSDLQTATCLILRGTNDSSDVCGMAIDAEGGTVVELSDLNPDAAGWVRKSALERLLNSDSSS